MLKKEKRDKLSKFMSLILRHKPHDFGIVLNSEGYCEIDDLLTVFQNDEFWKETNHETIMQVVKECAKQRYEVNGSKIRARYGHSSQKITYPEGNPPSVLLHGTNTKVVDLIFETGIQKMNREYVHLSEGTEFATLAGKRRGTLVLLKVDTQKAKENGVKFYYAGNEVWLSTDIPPNKDCFEIYGGENE